ncbi:hypothetical protein ACIBG7_18650 [Nonomuraea sp. NPDC050328]|uniref:hypothetical protein n=1 Tax=Nonomuraea sp. NPDC050328 TaxID=3364361 RepID=UPI0037A6351D
MAEQRDVRWTDAGLSPGPVSGSGTYPGIPQGPKQQAPLHDQAGLLLGHVWTDGQAAAGFSPDRAAGPAGVRASGQVWGIMRDAYVAGRPAAGVLDPSLFRPDFELRVD